MLSGIRTEDARAPRWREVDPDAGTVAVDDRYGAPETKTDKPRRWQDLDRSDN
jgi:hypothetical protein